MLYLIVIYRTVFIIIDIRRFAVHPAVHLCPWQCYAQVGILDATVNEHIASLFLIVVRIYARQVGRALKVAESRVPTLSVRVGYVQSGLYVDYRLQRSFIFVCAYVDAGVGYAGVVAKVSLAFQQIIIAVTKHLRYIILFFASV